MMSNTGHPSLAHLFDIVAPSIPGALIEPALRGPLRRHACALPALARAGFEVRLGRSPRVDLQQRVTLRDDEPRRVRDHIVRARWKGPAARGLDRLLARWSDRSAGLHDSLSELWLEFDWLGDRVRNELLPLSVFLGLEGADAVSSRNTIDASVDALTSCTARGPWKGSLERCLDACPDGTIVSHIGVMIGRPAPHLRINVKRLDGETLSPYLRDVGWHGPLADAEALFEELRPGVDRVTICLDVGAELSPAIGLECALDGQPSDSARWQRFLAGMVGRGWCLPAKRQALLEWPGLTTPSDAPAPWPATLMRSDLLRGPDHLPVLERQVSHVKITIGRSPAPEVKAYFGFFPTWLRPSAAHDDVRPDSSVYRRDGERLHSPADRAMHYLLAAQTERGWWRDFAGRLDDGSRWRAGASDEWVTAYVGTVLAGMDNGHARRAARAAWQRLADRRPPAAGWGFNRLTPPDADSTAWALRLASAIGEGTSTHARGAQHALIDHVRPDGGLTTYRPDVLGASAGALAGWSQTSHVCVTGAAAPYAGRPAAEFLRRAQRGAGAWRGYWWLDPEYATALAAEALAATGSTADQARVEAAVAWVLARMGADGSIEGSAFATALGVRILRCSNQGDAARKAHRRGVEWLLGDQREDGSWSSSARLRVPRPHVTDPDASAACTTTADDAAVFTTATVLTVLVSRGS